MIKEDKLYDLSVNNMITQTSNVYFESYERDASWGGDNAIATGYVASWRGPVLEKDDPYAEGEKAENIMFVKGTKPVKHIQEVLFLPERKSPRDNDLVKKMVMKYGGVSAPMWKGTPSTFGKYFNIEKSAWYYTENYMNKEGNGHAVTIVGWDDDFPKENFTNTPDGDGAWIVKNTKGANWGTPDGKGPMDGYFYISYYDMMFGAVWSANIGMSVVSRIDEVDNYDNIHQYDLLGYVEKMESDSAKGEAIFGNAFNIEKNEELKAVSFYTLEEDVDFEIFVGVENKYSILDEKYSVIKGSFEIPGYHTVDLEKSINLEKGNVNVFVKLKKNGKTPSIALDSRNGINKTTSVSKKNQSFILKNGKIIDLADEQKNSNVCLKIFTDNIIDKKDIISVEDMKKEVDFVVDRIRKDHAVVKEKGYTSEQKEIIDDVYDSISNPMEKIQYFVQLNRLFTMIKDGHTSLHYRLDEQYLPISFQWIEDGIIVDRTWGNFVLGDKITSIGGKKPEELEIMLFDVISGENIYWMRTNSKDVILKKSILKYFDLINDDGTVDIEYERNGEKRIVREEFGNVSINGQNNHIDKGYLMRVEEENDMAYFRLEQWYSNYSEDENNPKVSEINGALDKFFIEVKEKGVNNLVLDLRQNNGGGGAIFRHLIRYLDIEVQERFGGKYNQNKFEDDKLFKGKLYIMISYESFSYSIHSTTQLRGAGLCTTFGENSGAEPNFTLHVNGADGDTPITEIGFMMSGRRLDSIQGFSNDEKWITPDITVNRTRSDIIGNRDRQLERMREVTRDSSNIVYEKGDALLIWKNDEIKVLQNQKEFKSDLSKNTIAVPFGLKDNKVKLVKTDDLSEVSVEIKDMKIKAPESISGNYYVSFESEGNTYMTLVTFKNELFKDKKSNISKEQSNRYDLYTEDGDKITNRNSRGIQSVDRIFEGDGYTFKISEGYLLNYIVFQKNLSKKQKLDWKLYEDGKRISYRYVSDTWKPNRVTFYQKESFSPEKTYRFVVPAKGAKFIDGTFNEEKIDIEFTVPELKLNFQVFENGGGREGVNIVFNKSIMEYDRDKISIIDENGDEIKLLNISNPRSRRNELVIKTNDLVSGKKYTVRIPGSTVIATFGIKYTEDIFEEFIAK